MSEPKQKTVQFRHPFFDANAEGVFRLGESDSRPVLAVPLGDQAVVYMLDGLKNEYLAEDYDDDAAMIDKIARALRYVKSLKIGDALPPEILTGKASWKPAEKFRGVAEKRIVAGLVKWNEGLDVRLSNPEMLKLFIAREVNPGRIATAIANLAEHVFPGDQNRVSKVEELIEELTDEFTYLEALKDMLRPIQRFSKTLDAIRTLYDTGSGNSEVDAVIRLHTIAMKLFGAQIAGINASIDDILLAMSDFSKSQRRMRDLRDNLHSAIRAWQEHLEPWRTVSPDTLSLNEVMPMVTELYRFLAPRYMPVDEWTLAGGENTDGLSRRMRYGRGGGAQMVVAA